ncbi:ComEC/Rec2 family competence protein [Paenibacillus sp. M1]|uniref:ComEC/Rec2 family competence protein n=1 Tax=Paenibacillus haidiansis TaxID=1574488 RepID=A0ABU7VPC9_9BACL
MERRPLAVIACCWIAGSGLSCLYDGTTFWLLWSGLTLIAPLFAVVGRLSWKRLLVLWLAFSLGAAYWAYNDGRNISGIGAKLEQEYSGIISLAADPGLEAEEIPIRMEGTIVSPVEIDGDRADFTLKLSGYEFAGGEGEAPGGSGKAVKKEFKYASREKIAVQVRLASQDELAVAASWKRGRKLAISGTLEAPSTARNFGGFDYRNYLRHQRIHWLLKAAGASAVTAGENQSFSISLMLGKIDDLRTSLGNRVGELFPDWQAGYMKGLIIGLADELEPEKYTQFTNLGLTHILAISGSHVAINVGLLFGLLRLCRITRETSLWIVMVFVPAYVLLTGFTPSVIRSGIMTMLGLYLMRRRLLKDGLNVLSAAALLMLIWDPYYLLNVSFQLSFAVTAGLILFVPLLSPYLRWLPERLRGATAITVAAQLVSYPLTIFYFNQFSLLSLAANMVIVPLVSLVALPLGTAALLASGLWLPLGQWIAYPVRLINSLTFVAAEWLNGRSGFMTYWKSPSLLWIAAFYLLTYGLLFRSARKKARQERDLAAGDDTVPLPPLSGGKGGQPKSNPKSAFPSLWLQTSWKDVSITAGLAAGLFALIFSGYQPANAKGIGHVQFIDVGQGDCALITTPEGVNILVDGGGTVSFRKASDAWRDRKEPFEVGAKTVVPLLKKRGIHRLDAIILTHGDQDHVGGLRAVVEQFPVGALILNGSLADSATMNKLMSAALVRDIPIYAAHAGMRLMPDHATVLQFLAPPAEPGEPGQAGQTGEAEIFYDKDQNHRSLVFRLDMDGASFLFTGDMDIAAEGTVLDSLSTAGPAAERVDVMKVAHHGSKTSTSEEWLAYFNPAVSVISVGASNSYGHPNPGVLERLAVAGSGIYRTDRAGEIQMKVTGSEILVRTKLGR